MVYRNNLQVRVGQKAIAAIESHRGTKYQLGSATDLLGRFGKRSLRKIYSIYSRCCGYREQMKLSQLYYQNF